MNHRSPQQPAILTKIEQVQHFDDFESWLTSDVRCEKKIRQRLNLAKSSFSSVKNIFRDRKLSIQKKSIEMFRVVGYHIWV